MAASSGTIRRSRIALLFALLVRADHLVELEQAVGIGVGLIVFLESRALELVQRQLSIVVGVGGRDVLGLYEGRRALAGRQRSVLVHVGHEEDVGHALLELRMVDRAVVVGVGLAERGARIVGRLRLRVGARRGERQRQPQRGGDQQLWSIAVGVHAGSAFDLPGAVRLPARGAVGLLLLAADDDGLLVLSAVGPVRQLVGAGRRDRAAVAGVGVVPHRRLAGLRALESLLCGLRRELLVAVVEVVAGGAAKQGAT